MTERGETYSADDRPTRDALRGAPKPEMTGDKARRLLDAVRREMYAESSAEARRMVASWLFDEFVRSVLPF